MVLCSLSWKYKSLLLLTCVSALFAPVTRNWVTADFIGFLRYWMQCGTLILICKRPEHLRCLVTADALNKLIHYCSNQFCKPHLVIQSSRTSPQRRESSSCPSSSPCERLETETNQETSGPSPSSWELVSSIDAKVPDTEF